MLCDMQDSRQLSPRSLPVVEVKGGVTARQEWAMKFQFFTAEPSEIVKN